jgi:hypothetical protein
LADAAAPALVPARQSDNDDKKASFLNPLRNQGAVAERLRPNVRNGSKAELSF